MLPENFPFRVRQRTESLFRNDKLNCAEAVLKAVMEESGRDCPLEMLRMASPFGRGMGGAGCACGALIGGQMALGAVMGRTVASGFGPENCAKAAKMLHDSFKKHHSATCCRILHKGQPYGTREQLDSCAIRAAESGRIAAEIIEQFLDK